MHAVGEKLDYKKEYKDLYGPGSRPSVIRVPEMRFIMVDGTGDPNTGAEYQAALEVLYGLSYAIKMSKMGGAPPEGYFEYVVPPLEGLWWFADETFDASLLQKKELFCWTSMIRQPGFVTEPVFEAAKAALARKKPGLDLSRARLADFEEGLCVQVMHIGPYDDEPATIEEMDAYAKAEGYRLDFSTGRRHHEIYLGDPRKTKPERLRTVLRHPIAKA